MTPVYENNISRNQGTDALQQLALSKRLRSETAWKLLAADSSPVTLALLTTHLLEKERRLPSSILHERIDRELQQLREQGETLA